MPVVMRTILFWLLMLALAVVLWKMAQQGQGRPSSPSSSMSYSDFMAQVEKNNVASIRLVESPSTAEVEGQLRQPPDKFQTTIPKETIAALTEQLRKEGVPIEVSEQKKRTPEDLAIDISIFIALLGLWFYQVMRRRAGSRPNPTTPSTTPTIPTNRPLG